MATALAGETLTNKELNPNKPSNAHLITNNCPAPDAAAIQRLKTEDEEPEKMDIDADLTTTETLDDLDELDDMKPARIKNANSKNPSKGANSKVDEQLHKQPSSVKEEKQLQLKVTPNETSVQAESQKKAKSPATTKSQVTTETPAEPAAEGEPEIEDVNAAQMATCPAPPRAVKVPRKNLNGSRSPAMIKRLRKSTRSTRFKSKTTAHANSNRGAATASTVNGHNGQQFGSGAGQLTSGTTPVPGGKTQGKAGAGGAAGASGARNRRTLFKRPAQKTPRLQASTQYVKSVFYKGSYMQIGDIVSIVDSEGNVFYAQIRGLLVDAYCEKSAFLTWLIPTQDSPDPQEGFDPATYLIGPDEELSRKLCYLEFVMHAPSNYYYDCTTPFPLPDTDEYTLHRSGGYIWTRLPTVKRERERERDKERERDRKSIA